MSALRLAAEQYLAMRRALGFKLSTQGAHLMSFVAYCEARSVDHVTADLALEWATETPRASSDGVYQARRLDVVRIFARHLQPLDPATEVPTEDVLPHRYRRTAPYLYSAEDLTALMNAADDLSPAIRATTWRTLIGLLATTGMRVGEACRLRREEVDLAEATIVVADSKFGNYAEDAVMPSPVTVGVAGGGCAQDCSA
jgi:integrase